MYERLLAKTTYLIWYPHDFCGGVRVVQGSRTYVLVRLFVKLHYFHLQRAGQQVCMRSSLTSNDGTGIDLLAVTGRALCGCGDTGLPN